MAETAVVGLVAVVFVAETAVVGLVAVVVVVVPVVDEVVGFAWHRPLEAHVQRASAEQVLDDLYVGQVASAAAVCAFAVKPSAIRIDANIAV